MQRFSIKIVGASGQGLISIGEILAKAFKRSGYCVFGYREYMSLIKGGHGSYQIDVSDESIFSSEEKIDVLVTLNHHGFKHNLGDLKEGGLVIHDREHWSWKEDQKKIIEEKKLRVLFLPVMSIVQKLNAKPILGNVIFSAFVWDALGGDLDLLKSLVGERFAHKKTLLEANMQAIDAGAEHRRSTSSDLKISLPRTDKKQWEKQLLLTGSHAMGMGTAHAGVRMFVSYPMTPASPLLSYVADIQNQTGILVKQAEDEITAAQMMSGAMFMGTRAITGTSGGGFDLMTETLSMDGIAENPAVFVLAQRPGPGTGLPTWTAQGDLLLAIFSGHGEFPRIVRAVSDAKDAFAAMPEALNKAEEFQTPVIVMTDKHVAEGIFTVEPFDQKRATLSRGSLVTKKAELAELTAESRYDPEAKDGVSQRWLPGTEAATYVGQTDEHRSDGSPDETGENATLQMEKRLRKVEAIKAALPEPELWNANGTLRESDDDALDLLIVGWGSTKGAIIDAMRTLGNARVAYLHFSWLFPLKTQRLEKLAAKAKKVILVEGNAQGQLGMLIRQESGINITEKILKYDGRPFFLNELTSNLGSLLTTHH